MARFFEIDRSTLSTWETFGPPPRGPVRMLVLIVLKRLQKRYDDINEHARKHPAAAAGASPPESAK